MVLTPLAPNPFLDCLACAIPIIGIVGGGAATAGGVGAAYAWKLYNESKDEPTSGSPAPPAAPGPTAVPQPDTDDLSPRPRATYDDATTKNNLNHMFGQKKHDLDPLVEKYGSEEAVVKEIVRGIEGKTPADGTYEEKVNIDGEEVTVSGRVVNGIP